MFVTSLQKTGKGEVIKTIHYSCQTVYHVTSQNHCSDSTESSEDHSGSAIYLPNLVQINQVSDEIYVKMSIKINTILA